MKTTVCSVLIDGSTHTGLGCPSMSYHAVPRDLTLSTSNGIVIFLRYLIMQVEKTKLLTHH